MIEALVDELMGWGDAELDERVRALDPAEVVDEAWTSMLAGRPFVVLPKTVMLSETPEGVVPTSVRQ